MLRVGDVTGVELFPQAHNQVHLGNRYGESCSRFTTHYVPLTAGTTYYVLLTTYYLLLTTYYSLLTTHYSLLTTHYSLLDCHVIAM